MYLCLWKGELDDRAAYSSSSDSSRIVRVRYHLHVFHSFVVIPLLVCTCIPKLEGRPVQVCRSRMKKEEYIHCECLQRITIVLNSGCIQLIYCCCLHRSNMKSCVNVRDMRKIHGSGKLEIKMNKIDRMRMK